MSFKWRPKCVSLEWDQNALVWMFDLPSHFNFHLIPILFFILTIFILFNTYFNIFYYLFYSILINFQFIFYIS